MERKALLTNIIVLLVMMVGIGVAVYFLYSNVGVSSGGKEVEGAEYDLNFPGAGVESGCLAEVPAQSLPEESCTVTKETEKVTGQKSVEREPEPEKTEPAVVPEFVSAAVDVPVGPFDVKNSKSGKINQFSQTKDLSLVLKDEGKTLWLTSFHVPICGRVQTLDYFANGNLQFVFCAGSQLYLIDRLGRFVKGFPKDLGKEVLLGPDIYDFNGQKVYNLLVLHKDNTIQMYNMKGQKPSSWEGMTSKDTVLDLPERLEVGGRTFWVIRTAVEKLIFPFYGGNPVKTSAKIAEDSVVEILDSSSVRVKDQKGNVMTVKLR